MFIPAPRDRTKHGFDRSSRSEPGEARSSGVQTAPRANTGTSLTRSVEPVALEAPRSAGRETRTRPAAAATCSRPGPRPISSVTCAAPGSPWVCGHQRWTPGTTSSPSAVHPSGPPRQRQLALDGSRSGPTAPPRPPRPAAAPASGRRLARTASVPSEPRSLVRSRAPRTLTIRAALEPTGRHGPTQRRPGREPGRAAEQHRAVEAQVARRDQPRAPARARAAPGDASSGASARQAITSSFSAAPSRSRLDLDRVRARTSSSPDEHAARR